MKWWPGLGYYPLHTPSTATRIKPTYLTRRRRLWYYLLNYWTI